METKKPSLFQIAYTSEWALAKFFLAMFRREISDYFNLVGICGREKNKEEVRGRLFSEIENRTQALRQGKTWRMGNTIEEMRSCVDLLEKLANDNVKYFPIENGNGNLPRLAGGYYDAVAIFTTNSTHINYIEQLFKRNVHILCEKPAVIVTDENHRADRIQLNRLERIVEQNNDNLILMDAEHYSAKKATITFYERVGDMVAEYGKISKIEACTKEVEDPEKPRTRKLLCRNNRTGLLLDMGVHLFGVITNIEGDVIDISDAKYDIYPGHKDCPSYDVETYVETKFNVEGQLFHDNAKGEFVFAKFIDKFRNPESDDIKQFKISFKKQDKDDKNKTIETLVTVDFRKGIVKDSNGKTWHSYSEPSDQEYVNILKNFYNSIVRGQAPRTSFANSIKNLDAIYRTYEKFPVTSMNNRIEVYRR